MNRRHKAMLEYLFDRAQPCLDFYAPEEYETPEAYAARAGIGIADAKNRIKWWDIKRMRKDLWR